jgi:hypothetical protein
MTPQDFKVLLDVLNRIATALEGKDDNVAVETVNRFAETYRMLEDLEIASDEAGQPELSGMILEIRKTHVRIANEILSIYQQK